MFRVVLAFVVPVACWGATCLRTSACSSATCTQTFTWSGWPTASRLSGAWTQSTNKFNAASVFYRESPTYSNVVFYALWCKTNKWQIWQIPKSPDGKYYYRCTGAGLMASTCRDNAFDRTGCWEDNSGNWHTYEVWDGKAFDDVATPKVSWDHCKVTYACSTGSGTKCRSCYKESSRTANNQCYSCNSGHYQNIVSYTCHAYSCATGNSGTRCKTCRSAQYRTATNQCNSCNSGYTLDADRKCASSSCDKGYYKDGSKCSPYSCSTGSSGDDCKVCQSQSSRTANNQCTSCNSGSRISGTRCYPYTCSTGGGSKCYSCPSRSSRTADDQCNSCNSGYKISGTKCSASTYSCSTGTDASCATCRSASQRTATNHCESCNSAYKISGTKCISKESCCECLKKEIKSTIKTLCKKQGKRAAKDVLKKALSPLTTVGMDADSINEALDVTEDTRETVTEDTRAAAVEQCGVCFNLVVKKIRSDKCKMCNSVLILASGKAVDSAVDQNEMCESVVASTNNLTQHTGTGTASKPSANTFSKTLSINMKVKSARDFNNANYTEQLETKLGATVVIERLEFVVSVSYNFQANDDFDLVKAKPAIATAWSVPADSLTLTVGQRRLDDDHRARRLVQETRVTVAFKTPNAAAADAIEAKTSGSSATARLIGELAGVGIKATFSPLAVPPSVQVNVRTKVTAAKEIADLSATYMNSVVTTVGGISGSATVTELEAKGSSLDTTSRAAKLCSNMIAGLLVLLLVF